MTAAGRRLLVLALLSALGGCAWARPENVAWMVTRVREHGPYRAATLDDGREALRLYFVPQGGCATLIRPEALLAYVERGRLGRFEQGGVSCEPVGVGSLQAWVRRRPRPEVLTNLPRATAHFRVIHRDEAIVVVRGRFPLAEMVQWAGGEDSVAFLPNDPSCRIFIEQGSGTMQYSRTSREVLWMGARSSGGRCPFLGFARSVPETP